MPDEDSIAPPPVLTEINPNIGMQTAERLPSRTRVAEGIVKLSVIAERVVLPCLDLDTVTVQMDAITESAVFPTFTQKASNDGFNYTAISGAATVNAAGLTVPVTVTGYAFYAFEITTVGSGSGRALITITGKATN